MAIHNRREEVQGAPLHLLLARGKLSGIIVGVAIFERATHGKTFHTKRMYAQNIFLFIFHTTLDLKFALANKNIILRANIDLVPLGTSQPVDKVAKQRK